MPPRKTQAKPAVKATSKPAKRGRPVTGIVRHQINIRPQPHQLDAWKAAAEKSRRSLSDWIRLACDDAAEKVGEK